MYQKSNPRKRNAAVRWAASGAKRVASYAARQTGKALLSAAVNRVVKKPHTTKRTKTKANSLHQGMMSSNGPVTYSAFKVFKKPPHIVTKLGRNLPINTFRNITSFKQSGPQNQIMAYDFPILQKTETNNLMAQLFNEQPLVMDPAGATAVTNTYRLYIKQVKIAYSITNFQFNNLNCQAYDLISVDSGGTQPVHGLDLSQVDMNDTAIAPNRFPIGMTPNQSRDFSKFWKVLKVTNIAIRPGTTHMHYVTLNVNQTIQNISLQQSEVHKGFARSTLFLFQGFPVAVAGNGTATCALGATDVGIIASRIYKYGQIMNQTSQNNTINGLTTLGAPQIVNEYNDAPQADGGI